MTDVFILLYDGDEAMYRTVAVIGAYPTLEAAQRAAIGHARDVPAERKPPEEWHSFVGHLSFDLTEWHWYAYSVVQVPFAAGA